MKYFDFIKKHSASLEIIYDFSEFSGRLTFKKMIRLFLRLFLLIPCYLFYLSLLIQIMIIELLAYFASIPGNAIARVRANAGYDTKEYKWLFILTYLILYLVFLIFDIIEVLTPVLLAVLAFFMDAILWIAHLGRSEFINQNIILDKESSPKIQLIIDNANKNSFSEVFINIVLVNLILIFSSGVLHRSGLEDYLLVVILFLGLLQFGNYLYYKKLKLNRINVNS